ncbi:MAG: trigger factor [Planctomycetota bacterium]
MGESQQDREARQAREDRQARQAQQDRQDADKGQEKDEEQEQKPLGPAVEVEDLGAWKRKLRIEVPAESVKGEYEDALRELSHNAQVKGFRKGHVPRVLLLKQFGEALTDDVKLKIVAKATQEALDRQELEPVSDPALSPVRAEGEEKPEEAEKPEGDEKPADAEEPAAEPGPLPLSALTPPMSPDVKESFDRFELDAEKAFAFEVACEVKPTFELPEYKGLKLTRRKQEVTNDLVESNIEMLRRRDADYVAVEEGGAASGDRLTVTARLEVEGESIWDAEHEICHLAEDLLLGLPARAKREDIEGLAPGEERTVDVKIPDNYKEEEHRGKDAQLVLKLEELKRPEVPPLDDEAAQKLGVQDAGALRRTVREQLEARTEAEAREDLEKQVADQLVEKAAFDLPEGLFERASRSREMEQILGLTRMGLLSQESAVAALSGSVAAPPPEGAEAPEDGAGADAEQQKITDRVRQDARESTERNLKARLILEKIAEAEKIDVSDDDVEEEVFRRAQTSGRTPVAVRSELERQGGLDSLREALATSKVVNFIVEQADISNAQESSA